jgi:hypothetical protein
MGMNEETKDHLLAYAQLRPNYLAPGRARQETKLITILPKRMPRNRTTPLIKGSGFSNAAKGVPDIQQHECRS